MRLERSVICWTMDEDTYANELTLLKARYELKEQKLCQLRILADRAIHDYDDLQERFQESEEQNKQLRQKLAVAETKALSLENVIEPAILEFDQLQKHYEIERSCRSEAEKYASKMRKQNVNLKRQSQMLLQRFQIVDFTIEERDSSAGEDVPDANIKSEAEDERDVLNRKIKDLEETIQILERRLSSTEEDKMAAYEREQYNTEKIRVAEDSLNTYRQRIRALEEEMGSLRKMSEMAIEEFEDLKKTHEREMNLKYEAEKYANSMLSERDAIVRESSIILSSVSGDARLTTALMAIEELTKQLQAEKLEHLAKIDKLSKELEYSSQQNQASDRERKLEFALEENDRQQRQIVTMEQWKLKLERENIDLINQLDVCQQKLRPPPPPPPPPPPTMFSPLKYLARKKPVTSSKPQEKEADVKDKTYEVALKEMMDRIKTGRTLKQRPQKQMSLPEVENSAMANLQQVLSGSARRRRNNPRDEQPVDKRTEPPEANELLRKFREKKLLNQSIDG
jgi:hypothetical protein